MASGMKSIISWSASGSEADKAPQVSPQMPFLLVQDFELLKTGSTLAFRTGKIESWFTYRLHGPE